MKTRSAGLLLVAWLCMTHAQTTGQYRNTRNTLQLEEACRIVGSHDKTLIEKECSPCGNCHLGPIVRDLNDTIVKVYYCEYFRAHEQLEPRACLVQNGNDYTIIRQRHCPPDEECTLGPVKMKLPNITLAFLYLCQKTNTGYASHSFKPRWMPPGGRMRSQAQHQWQQETVSDMDGADVLEMLMEQSCRVVNISEGSNALVSSMRCCPNCSAGPVSLTTDQGRLQLYFCDNVPEDQLQWFPQYRRTGRFRRPVFHPPPRWRSRYGSGVGGIRRHPLFNHRWPSMPGPSGQLGQGDYGWPGQGKDSRKGTGHTDVRPGIRDRQGQDQDGRPENGPLGPDGRHTHDGRPEGPPGPDGRETQEGRPADGPPGPDGRETQEGRAGDGPPGPDRRQTQVGRPGDGPPDPDGRYTQDGRPGDGPRGPDGRQTQEGRPGDGPSGPDGRQTQDGRPGDGPPGPDRRQTQEGRPGDGPPGPDGRQRQDGDPGDGPPGRDGRQTQEGRPGDGPPGPDGRHTEEGRRGNRPVGSDGRQMQDGRPGERPPGPDGRYTQEGRPGDGPPGPDGRQTQEGRPRDRPPVGRQTQEGGPGDGPPGPAGRYTQEGRRGNGPAGPDGRQVQDGRPRDGPPGPDRRQTQDGRPGDGSPGPHGQYTQERRRGDGPQGPDGRRTQEGRPVDGPPARFRPTRPRRGPVGPPGDRGSASLPPGGWAPAPPPPDNRNSTRYVPVGGPPALPETQASEGPDGRIGYITTPPLSGISQTQGPPPPIYIGPKPPSPSGSVDRTGPSVSPRGGPLPTTAPDIDGSRGQEESSPSRNIPLTTSQPDGQITPPTSTDIRRSRYRNLPQPVISGPPPPAPPPRHP